MYLLCLLPLLLCISIVLWCAVVQVPVKACMYMYMYQECLLYVLLMLPAAVLLRSLCEPTTGKSSHDDGMKLPAMLFPLTAKHLNLVMCYSEYDTGY